MPHTAKPRWSRAPEAMALRARSERILEQHVTLPSASSGLGFLPGLQQALNQTGNGGLVMQRPPALLFSARLRHWLTKGHASAQLLGDDQSQLLNEGAHESMEEATKCLPSWFSCAVAPQASVRQIQSACSIQVASVDSREWQTIRPHCPSPNNLIVNILKALEIITV